MNRILNWFLAKWEAYAERHRDWRPYRMWVQSLEHPRDSEGKSLRHHRVIMRRMVDNRWQYRTMTAEEARKFKERQNSSW